MSEYYNTGLVTALRDFRRARLKADMERLVARLSGKPVNLLPYDAVRQQLKASITSQRELKEIPLDSIVGSVGRYTDFTRSFLPLSDSVQARWANIELRATTMQGLPPIEVYQIGQVYFVIDGNHRVSVARQLEATHIEAYVTQVRTKVPLTPDVDIDDVIAKARYLEFLERTGLDRLRPDADLSTSVPGQYRILDRHIALHRYFMSLEQQKEIPYEEAVTNWYDEVYLVVVEAIRQQKLLEAFPGRTETDLYLWVSGYRTLVEEELGWQFEAGEAGQNQPALAPGPRFQNMVSRLVGKIAEAILPAQPETALLPGQWRREHLLTLLESQSGRPFRLFTSILVPVNGQEVGWYALYQALGIARREGGRLLGLHVVPNEAGRDSPDVNAIRARFNRRCAKMGVPGRLAVEVGNVTTAICQRARWADLVVVRLVYPPAPQPIARLGPGFHTLIRRCHTPMLVVPRNFVYPLDRALLAYDGSAKATEALYIAAYLALQWEISLVVLTVADDQAAAGTLQEAQNYLQARGVQAVCVQAEGPVAETIVATAKAHNSNLIIMGGYGRKPVLEIMLGSAVDEVLRTSRRPVLICR